MENTTYSNIEKITDEAPRNIEPKELETFTISSIETFNISFLDINTVFARVIVLNNNC